MSFVAAVVASLSQYPFQEVIVHKLELHYVLGHCRISNEPTVILKEFCVYLSQVRPQLVMVLELPSSRLSRSRGALSDQKSEHPR